jgi:hypothetical protein
MVKPAKADFGIEIDFEPGTESPSRIFRTMGNLIESFQQIDRRLVAAIDSKIEPVLMLEDIEAGSLRAWLANGLNAINDEALKNLDWRPLVGQYLVKGKRILIDFIQNKTTVTTRQEIGELEQQLLRAATETNVRQIPAYEAIPTAEIIESLVSIREAISPLKPSDKAKYLSEGNESNFNLDFYISPDSIEDLLTRETLSDVNTMILKVKRPDYLGESMWDFRHETKPIPAKITDLDWLSKFQNRIEEVRPGDALKARVKIDVKYDFDGEVIATHYTVLEVIEVIKVGTPRQGGLPLSPPDLPQ